MHKALANIDSAYDLHSMSLAQLEGLADEIRDALCNLLACRTAHFASNLGVVELCLALHSVYDFRRDRLIWDTGHQIYPHKLVTGRFDEFHTIRQQGGLMGYPNPAESDYDLFVTGHAGASLSTVLGLQSADALLRPEEGRKAVAVIGDGALPSGIVFEAMNNAAGMNSDMLVVLNDNGMGICPRVGGLASCKPAIDLGLKLGFALLHALITHRLVLRGIGLDFGTVERDVAELDQTGLLAQPQHLHEQPCKRRQVTLAEIRDGAEVRRIERHDRHEVDPLAARPGKPARRVDALGVAIKQQRRHHPRVEWRLAGRTAVRRQDRS